MKDQISTRHELGNIKYTSFPFEKFGALGVGKLRTPIVNMDKYIDHSRDQELHIECCRGLAIARNYGTGMLIGALPPHEVEAFQGNDSWTEMLNKLDEIDPSGVHRKVLEEISETCGADAYTVINKYCYYALGSVIPWFFTLYLKNNNFNTKTTDITEWTKDSELFPNVIEYVKTLPFKEIGRVLFFATYPNAGVVTHRDSPVVEHSDHSINLFFSSSRPSYIWDEIENKKIYLPQDAKSYFFNNRDYHGVDPEPQFRYTLRVDGTFTDELCEELGLVDGKTWSWNYL